MTEANTAPSVAAVAATQEQTKPAGGAEPPDGEVANTGGFDVAAAAHPPAEPSVPEADVVPMRGDGPAEAGSEAAHIADGGTGSVHRDGADAGNDDVCTRKSNKKI